MTIADSEKKLVFSNRNKPLVGLINKKNKKIVFAPCITQKVSLKLNEREEAISGSLVCDSPESNSTIETPQLSTINNLLKCGHVPRYAYTWSSPEDVKSSHEFLFKQKCQPSDKANWGGFTLWLDESDNLELEFVSGAFNSKPLGKREKGAELSTDLIIDVKNETAVLGRIKPPMDESSTSFETPPKKRVRLHAASRDLLFSTSANLNKPEQKEDEAQQKQSLTSHFKNS